MYNAEELEEDFFGYLRRTYDDVYVDKKRRKDNKGVYFSIHTSDKKFISNVYTFEEMANALNTYDPSGPVKVVLSSVQCGSVN